MKRALILLFVLTTSFTVFGQNNKTKKTVKKETSSKQIKYKCPMHADETSTRQGKCKQCGMIMVKASSKSYTCPMHPEMTIAMAGKCKKCGMEMEKSATAYSCPMHPEETNVKGGKCSKCGMAMKTKKG